MLFLKQFMNCFPKLANREVLTRVKNSKQPELYTVLTQVLENGEEE